jgi:GT2 family glycosyltransferase
MLGYAQRNDVGAVGAKLYYPDMSIQFAGGMITKNEAVCDHIFRFLPKGARGYKNNDLLTKNVSLITGACILCRKDVYIDAGYMTEEFEVSFGDSDFCMKILTNELLIVYHPYVELIHYEGKTRGHCDTLEEVLEFRRERELFRSKWSEELGRGDLYSPPDMDIMLFDKPE